MPQHDAPWTPGPWSLGTVAVVLDDGYYEAPDEAVIYCGPDAGQNDGEIRIEGPNARADARLIAAAPALYEALCFIVSEIETDGGVDTSEWLALDKARAALALACGETNG